MGQKQDKYILKHLRTSRIFLNSLNPISRVVNKSGLLMQEVGSHQSKGLCLALSIYARSRGRKRAEGCPVDVDGGELFPLPRLGSRWRRPPISGHAIISIG